MVKAKKDCALKGNPMWGRHRAEVTRSLIGFIAMHQQRPGAGGVTIEAALASVQEALLLCHRRGANGKISPHLQNKNHVRTYLFDILGQTATLHKNHADEPWSSPEQRLLCGQKVEK